MKNVKSFLRRPYYLFNMSIVVSETNHYNCQQCGKEVFRFPSALKGTYVFCNRSCSATFHNKTKIVIKECPSCHKSFHPVRGGRGIFCSSQCNANYKQSQTYVKIENGTYSVNHYDQKVMREYLIKTRGRKCEQCNNSNWQGTPINLTVEHTDGNWNNNLLTNVKLLCWNCHSMTSTFGKKNKNGMRKKRTSIYQLGKKILDGC